MAGFALELTGAVVAVGICQQGVKAELGDGGMIVICHGAPHASI